MFVYVGGYTTSDRDGRGDGINVYRVGADGGWAHLQHVGGLENPSLFTLNRAKTRLYSVHGGRKVLTAFAVDGESGRLTLLNQIDCGGSNPVDSALDPSERFLVVANYGTGSVEVVTVEDDGRLGAVCQSFVLEGTPGPHPKEQSSSHPHAVIFDPSGQFVVVPDKGFDRTYLFRFRDGKLEATAQGSVVSAAGAAPRHTVFHPTLPVLYVNNELDSTVTVFDWVDGVATEKQVIRTVEDGFSGHNTTAEIAASGDGRFLYVSNRGQDSIVRFDIEPGTGLLTRGEEAGSGGKRPRFFTFDPSGERIFVGNQDSDTVTGFAVDKGTGRLTGLGVWLGVGSPSAISFV
jgi:6-phosphogluconolactonase